MIYKRSNMSLKNDSKIEYVDSNNEGISLISSITGANFAPYHGIYINQEAKKDNIYLSKMIEHITIGHDNYEIMDIKTSENVYGGSEYLEEFTNIPVPTYKYVINNCIIEKKYKLVPNEKILCIEYKITNTTGRFVKFRTSPCVTKRGLFTPRRQSDLKFTSQVVPGATKIALSISENLDLYIKSTNMKYNKHEGYICGVNYDYEIEPGKIKTYVEDLFVPGNFEASIKSGNTATYEIYVATEDVNTKKYKSQDIEQDIIARDNIRYGSIDKNYHELLDLAKTAYTLHYVNKQKKQLVLLESLPSIYESDEYIKNMIVSIEGNYLLLKRYKEAHKIFESMMLKLKDATYSLSNLDRCEALLLFIEALNRYMVEAEVNKEEVKIFYEYIKTSIYEILDKKNKNICIDNEFILVIDGKKYIKHNALWYNALRVFVDLADKFKEESEFIYTISEKLKESIIQRFWDDEANVLKYELADTSYPTFDMVYALSLSYPVIYDPHIAMKLVDKTFKTLYTAYGMRLGATNTEQYDGFVYPHLLVHFLKANLRQMGVTRASQKLAYNLVKDTLLEIGKNTVGTVSYKYEEKTKKTYGNAVSAITNGELIRAFDMLT